MDLITEEQAFKMLTDAVIAHGSQMALADEMDIDYSYLNFILTGRRPLRHKKVLEFLGLQSVRAFITTKGNGGR